MVKAKDFYGKDISDVIEQACKTFGTNQAGLSIEVLETGSTGIFGLCKKKAHIRASRREEGSNQIAAKTAAVEVVSPVATSDERASEGKEELKAQPKARSRGKKTPTTKIAPEGGKVAPEGKEALVEQPETGRAEGRTRGRQGEKKSIKQADPLLEVELLAEPIAESKPPPVEAPEEEAVPVLAPSEQDLTAIRDATTRFLQLMNRPSEVEVSFTEQTIHCRISGEHEEAVIGPEGRILDSMQYLLRKMIGQHLPERVILSLNAGNFRERRLDELKARALDFANQVREDGKTRALAALNPAERRFVHLALQDEKEISSRSVGDGLFKKVLIYKTGTSKGPRRRSGSRKRRGGQNGRTADD